MSNSGKPDSMDLLLYAAAATAGKNELAEFEAADEGLLSPQAEKRIFRKICREINYHKKHEYYHPVSEGLKRVAMVILVIMSISLIGVLSIKAVRIDIYHAVIEWFDKKINVSYNDISSETLDSIVEYKEPVLPGNYERFEIAKRKDEYFVEYESEFSLITYIQRPLNNYNSFISNENTQIVDVEVNGYEGIMTTFDSNGILTTTIIWKDTEYAYMLSSNITNSDLLQIAESVK